MPTQPSRQPLVLVNAVGMTSRLLEHAPRMQQLAEEGWVRRLREVIPAVTSTAQATILTGKIPSEHGIVANGWLFRDTMEVRFWQQSNRLLEAEPFYRTMRRLAASKGERFRAAKLFWWFNQGSDVDFSVTPKPHYGADGNKVFGVAGSPDELPARIEATIGPFPFHTFWGPKSGLLSTEWIANCCAEVLRGERPELTLVYLPHLDYEPQRRGPAGCDMPKLVGELDDALEPILDAAEHVGARVWIVSEYGHCQVAEPVYPNRILRSAGFLRVRPGPFGEMLDTFASEAFAVCDHQLCHVYVKDPKNALAVQDALRTNAGVRHVFVGAGRGDIGLDHPRSGELIALSLPDRWFAYPYWMVDSAAPDFARTVDIHRKCGFDPCELLFDPQLFMPELRVALRLLAKSLGFRTLFDVVPLNAGLIKGSHGLPAADPLDRPILIGDGFPPSANPDIPMTQVRDLVMHAYFE